MNFLKFSTLTTLFFISNLSFASICETYTGYKIKETVCFDKAISGWISDKCLDNKTCDAKKFFKLKKKPHVVFPGIVGGQNPAAIYCHQLKLEVLILKDSEEYEQSFCQFPDRSMVDANAVEGFMEK